MKLEFSLQFYEKYSNIKLHDNPFSASRVIPCRQKYGRTDRHDEPNSHFSQFFEHALKRRKYTIFPCAYQSHVWSDTYRLSRLATTDPSLWTVG